MVLSASMAFAIPKVRLFINLKSSHDESNFIVLLHGIKLCIRTQRIKLFKKLYSKTLVLNTV